MDYRYADHFTRESLKVCTIEWVAIRCSRSDYSQPVSETTRCEFAFNDCRNRSRRTGAKNGFDSISRTVRGDGVGEKKTIAFSSRDVEASDDEDAAVRESVASVHKSR